MGGKYSGSYSKVHAKECESNDMTNRTNKASMREMHWVHVIVRKATGLASERQQAKQACMRMRKKRKDETSKKR